jgi:hypothetical protein
MPCVLINLRATTVRHVTSLHLVRPLLSVLVDATTVLWTANSYLARVRMGDGICCRKIIAIDEICALLGC